MYKPSFHTPLPNAAASKMRALQQQVDRLQAALQDARAERAASESHLRVVVNQASLQQHRGQLGAASAHKVQAESARREAQDPPLRSLSSLS